MKKIIFTLSAAFIFCTSANAQKLMCGTPEYNQPVNPIDAAQYAKKKVEFEAGWNKYRTAHLAEMKTLKKAAQPKYIIPVVIHVMHNYGAENLSDAAIQGTIDLMNQYYRSQKAINIRPIFKDVVADCSEIEFRLAKKDPQGNCSTGITRTQTEQTNNANEPIKRLIAWDTKRYLNIWVAASVKSGGKTVGGYSTFPYATSSPAYSDGILLVASQFTSDNTGAHEAGHWFGLSHPFSSNSSDSCDIGSDGCFDTPPSYFEYSKSGSNTGRGNHCAETLYNTCSTDNPDLPDMQENIMDYFGGSCTGLMFTLEQKAKMFYSLDNYRSELWSADNLARTGVLDATKPCAPIPSFDIVYNATSISTTTCANNSYLFRQTSYNGTITTAEWTFNGGTPATYTATGSSLNATTPAITYNTPGTYDVILKVSGPNGSKDTVYKNYINILPVKSTIPINAYNVSWNNLNGEGNNGWYFENQVAETKIQWVKSPVSYSGNQSMLLPVNPANIGNKFYFISPSFNLEGAPSPYFKFKYAFTQGSYAPLGITASSINDQTKSLSADVLYLAYSIDCGKSWVTRSNKTGIGLYSTNIGSTPVLAPAIPYTSYFTPADQTKWAEAILPSNLLPTGAALANIKFRITLDYQGGNNFYLDEVQVGTATSINNDLLRQQLAFNIYPNPFNTAATLTYTLSKKENVETIVYDIAGKQIATLSNGLQAEGKHDILINKADLSLSNGIYFIKLQVGDNTLTQKIVLN